MELNNRNLKCSLIEYIILKSNKKAHQFVHLNCLGLKGRPLTFYSAAYLKTLREIATNNVLHVVQHINIQWQRWLGHVVRIEKEAPARRGSLIVGRENDFVCVGRTKSRKSRQRLCCDELA